ncbi:MAG: hypothetical protein ACJ8F7_10840 [Gemmataceae bacterium]
MIRRKEIREVEAFPFTESEWAAVGEAALPLVNAALADDTVLREAHLTELLEVLSGLRHRYGYHPVLLETEADFTEDEADRVAQYRRAIRIAESHGLPTLSPRLSFARLLLDVGEPEAAREELLACKGELDSAEELTQGAWAELEEESRHA